MFANNFGTFENVECGLVSRRIRTEKREYGSFHASEYVPVPLVSVSVTASVVHAVAQVEIVQVYRNRETTPIEAIYFFPTDSNGAVTHFQAEMDGRVIKGVVKSKEEAKEQYEKALKSQQTAFLGEEKKPDIFKVSIGNLMPGNQVKVIIGYVTEVKNEPDTHAVRFFIPTTVAPRYNPGSETEEKRGGEEMSNKMTYSGTSLAPLSIKVIASIQGEIKGIESNTHKIVVETTGTIPNKIDWHKWIVTLDGNTTEMDRDFVILIIPKEPLKPRLYSETLEDGSLAVMAHLIPSFKLTDQKVELIVLLDRSESMNGDSIEMAKKALLLFLHSMPADCYFNIVGFGSSFKFLFSKTSQKYDETTLQKAVKYADNLRADMGGTEIMTPLKAIYKCDLISGYQRQIFIITDGEVENTDEILGLIKSHTHGTRVFALGIGSSCSHYLVQGLAQAGRGSCAFVQSDENIQRQTLSQLKNSLQPAMSEITVKWNGIPVQEGSTPQKAQTRAEVNKNKTLVGYNKPLNPEEPYSSNIAANANFFQAPAKIPPVFDGSQMVVFGVFNGSDKPTGAVITAESPDGPLSIELELSPENDVGSTKMLHRLAAIKIVRELELEETDHHSSFKPRRSKKTIKEEIIEVAVKNGITSKYTSFVAVDDAEKCTKENWTMQSRYVPSQVPHGGGYSQMMYPRGSHVLIGRGRARSGPSTTARKSCGGSLHTRRELATKCARKSAPSVGGYRRPAKGKPKHYKGTKTNWGTKKVKKGVGKITTVVDMKKLYSIDDSEDEVDSNDDLENTSEDSEKMMSGALKSAENIIKRKSPRKSVRVNKSAEKMETDSPAEDEDVQMQEIGDPDEASGSRRRITRSTKGENLNVVYALINLQTFQGSFPLNSALCKVMELDINLIKKAAEKNKWDETVYATSLAITFLAEKLGALKQFWELVAIKADKWIGQKYSGGEKAKMMAAAKVTINAKK